MTPTPSLSASSSSSPSGSRSSPPLPCVSLRWRRRGEGLGLWQVLKLDHKLLMLELISRLIAYHALLLLESVPLPPRCSFALARR